MNYITCKSCEECHKRIQMEGIVVKFTDDGDCLYCPIH